MNQTDIRRRRSKRFILVGGAVLGLGTFAVLAGPQSRTERRMARTHHFPVAPAPAAPGAPMRAAAQESLGSSLLARIMARLDDIEKRLSSRDQEDDRRRLMIEQADRGPSPVEVRGTLDTALQKEATDPAWESEFRNRARNALSGESFRGADLLDIQCGSSLCRMDFKPADIYQAGNMLVELSGQGPHGGIWYTADESAVKKGTASYYVARAGTYLPLEPPPG